MNFFLRGDEGWLFVVSLIKIDCTKVLSVRDGGSVVGCSLLPIVGSIEVVTARGAAYFFYPYLGVLKRVVKRALDGDFALHRSDIRCHLSGGQRKKEFKMFHFFLNLKGINTHSVLIP